MKKITSMVISAVVMFIMVGCTSTRVTQTTTIDKEGKPQSVIVTEKMGYLVNKAVSVQAKAIGLEATMFDPNTGSYSPSIKILYGKAGTDTQPMIRNKEDADVNSFSEQLTIDTSMWGSEISSIEYSKKVSGSMTKLPTSIDVKLNITKVSNNSAKTNEDVDVNSNSNSDSTSKSTTNTINK